VSGRRLRMSDSGPIRVVIVDDHPMVRQGLKTYLSTCLDITVVGEAGDGRQAVEVCASASPDVVLMDMMLPDLDGATVTGLVKEVCPACSVIVLTSFVETEMVQRALEAGAISYLLKDSGPEKLLDAIREAHVGRGTIDSSAAQALLPDRRVPGARFAEDLTPREREVLALLAEGLTNKEIGTRLFLSLGTVRLHVTNVLRKMDAPNRTTAAMLAVQHGLMEKP
jgi:NarL family two-component system response regulator LiaR